MERWEFQDSKTASLHYSSTPLLHCSSVSRRRAQNPARVADKVRRHRGDIPRFDRKILTRRLGQRCTRQAAQHGFFFEDSVFAIGYKLSLRDALSVGLMSVHGAHV